MRTLRAIFLMGLLVSFAEQALAAECVIRTLPDGTGTAECPSESPTVPDAIPPPLSMPRDSATPIYRSIPTTPPVSRPEAKVPCITNMGMCWASFVQFPPNGWRCSCTDGFNTFMGIVQY